MLLASTPAGSAPGIDISATGGLISEYEVGGTRYRAHIFTNSSNFVVNAVPGDSPGVIEYLVVGGGGGGGGNLSGGGGAGGLRTNLS